MDCYKITLTINHELKNSCRALVRTLRIYLAYTFLIFGRMCYAICFWHPQTGYAPAELRAYFCVRPARVHFFSIGRGVAKAKEYRERKDQPRARKQEMLGHERQREGTRAPPQSALHVRDAYFSPLVSPDNAMKYSTTEREWAGIKYRTCVVSGISTYARCCVGELNILCSRCVYTVHVPEPTTHC